MSSLDQLGAVIGQQWPALATRGLSLSSAEVQAGTVFFALPGTKTHGLRFAGQAISRGAVAIVYDPQGAGDLPAAGEVPLLPVPGLSQKLGALAAEFYGRPAEALELVGVTGTDGKTSVVNLCAQLLRQCGRPTASLGTLGLDLGAGPVAGSHTTPDAIALQACFAQARDAGMTALTMEVSSHALAQGRVAGVPFAHVALTTLGRDHLDYHQDLADYHATKRSLLAWPGLHSVHLNADDPAVRESAQGLALAPLFYGGADQAHWRLLSSRPGAEGLALHLAVSGVQYTVQSGLYGDFNAGNILAAASLAEACGASVPDLVAAIPHLQTVPGRMECLRAGGRTVIIDYAHTPLALRSALRALAAHQPERLHCVFGCGGDRDRGKRPEMARAAESLADAIVLTDDNPRSEDPERIFSEVMAGFERPAAVRCEHDRGAAIRGAIATMRAGEMLLVAGKGHEDYQLVGNQRRNFSDRAVVAECLAGVAA